MRRRAGASNEIASYAGVFAAVACFTLAAVLMLGVRSKHRQ